MSMNLHNPSIQKWLTRCKLDSNFFTEKTRFTTFVASVFINNENSFIKFSTPKGTFYTYVTLVTRSVEIYINAGV